MRIRHVLPLLTFALAAISCGGSDGSKPTPPGGTQPTTLVVTTVIVAPPFAQLELGSSAAFTVEVHDQLGALMTGKVATWGSTDPRIATVDAGGVVKAVAVGTASVSATVEGKVGLTAITVVPVAVASVSIVAPASVTAGQTATFAATTKDKGGNVLTGRVVAWSSSAPRVATIDANGLLTAISAGTTTITATSENISATLSVVVAAPAGSVPPTIASIAPATLTRGATATITGANFGATPALNKVFISGVSATVTAASPTQLTVTVPAGVPCQVTQSVNVDVTTVAGTATGKQTLQTSTQRTLAVGGSFFATATGNMACTELPAAGTYIVSVFNAAKTATGVAGFELKGVAGTPPAGNIGTPITASASIIPAPKTTTRSAVAPEALAAEREHLQHLQADLDLIRQLGSPRRSAVLRSITGVTSMQSQVVIPTTVGATTTINYHFNSCRIGNATTITARVVYVGPHAIVLEDNAGALAGKIDADLTALATEWETTSFPLLGNFGNVLAYDDSTNRNGRLLMLFTPQVNSQSQNLLGFVSACDFYPPSVDPSVSASNQAEIFYARAVTDTSPTSNSINGKPVWRRQMPGTLIHESKHILAFGERFQTPIIVTAFEQLWLEEATAQQASELYGRALHGNGWRTNAGYQDALYCEVRPTTPRCNGATYVMGNHFGFLMDYLQSFESKSILSSDDYDVYGSSWLFARWLTDTYATGTESAFLQSVVKNYNVTGVDNVVSVAGKTWPELLSQFTLMLAADDLPNVPRQFQELSWNLPAVFQGYNADFPSVSASPLVLRQAYFASNFTASLSSIKGGGAMLLRINALGNAGSQLLDLHDFSGQPLDPTSNIGIAVLRIQ